MLYTRFLRCWEQPPLFSFATEYRRNQYVIVGVDAVSAKVLKVADLLVYINFKFGDNVSVTMDLTVVE